jgi:hypothetical protein
MTTMLKPAPVSNDPTILGDDAYALINEADGSYSLLTPKRSDHEDMTDFQLALAGCFLLLTSDDHARDFIADMKEVALGAVTNIPRLK